MAIKFGVFLHFYSIGTGDSREMWSVCGWQWTTLMMIMPVCKSSQVRLHIALFHAEINDQFKVRKYEENQLQNLVGEAQNFPTRIFKFSKARPFGVLCSISLCYNHTSLFFLRQGLTKMVF